MIKNLEYRTIKNHVFKDIDLTKVTGADLLEMVNKVVQSEGGFRPYRTVKFDSIKIYTKAHGSKTMNLAINLDHDDWIIDDMTKPLVSFGVENETEVSVFNREHYEEFKKNPQEKW